MQKVRGSTPTRDATRADVEVTCHATVDPEGTLVVETSTIVDDPGPDLGTDDEVEADE